MCAELYVCRSAGLYEYVYSTNEIKKCFELDNAVCYAKDAIMPSKIHTSMSEMNDGRIIMTTHTTSQSRVHPYWYPEPFYNHVFESGLDHRILFWQQHLVGATGFLYWATNWWRLIDDPWETMATVPDLSSNVFGDGSLLYYGSKVGIDGPCASVRLEAVRDGIEDCEMLLMADKALGREWVLEKVKTVSSDLKNYTDSAEVFNRVRNEIASALEKALNK